MNNSVLICKISGIVQIGFFCNQDSLKFIIGFCLKFCPQLRIVWRRNKVIIAQDAVYIHSGSTNNHRHFSPRQNVRKCRIKCFLIIKKIVFSSNIRHINQMIWQVIAFSACFGQLRIQFFHKGAGNVVVSQILTASNIQSPVDLPAVSADNFPAQGKSQAHTDGSFSHRCGPEHKNAVIPIHRLSPLLVKGMNCTRIFIISIWALPLDTGTVCIKIIIPRIFLFIRNRG